MVKNNLITIVFICLRGGGCLKIYIFVGLMFRRTVFPIPAGGQFFRIVRKDL